VNQTTVWVSDRAFSQSPTDKSFVNDPYSLYQDLHARGGPVFWEDYGFWCLTEFEAVDAALKDRRFARLPPPGMESPGLPAHLVDFQDLEAHSLLQLEPPLHTRLRKRVNRAFVARHIESMADEIEALVNECIDQFIDERSTNLLTGLATPVPVRVIAKLLGVPLEHCDDLLRWSHAMVKVYTMTQTREDEITANQAAIEYRACLLGLIHERRKNPQDDLLSHLAANEDPENSLTDDEILSVSVLLLNAGHEATVHQFGNMIYGLLRNDLAPRGGFDDVATAKQYVDEGLRHDAPLHLFLRYAQTDVALSDDVSLKAGEQVAVLLGAANRDPNRFEQASRFWPERSDGAHVSLGAGIHFCIGAALTGLELRILTDTLFRRIPDLALANTPEYLNQFHFHGLERLDVRW